MSRQRDLLAILSGQAKGPKAALARTGLSLVEPFYATATRARNALFDRGVKAAVPLGRPTVSVGNLTTGGTGKTPVVLWLARKFLESGRRPAVLLRGYKAENGLSDEAELYRQVDGLEVEPNPDRVAGAAAVLARSPGVDVFLLDDGFQHRRAARDFDLVLIDATNPFGHDHVLPRGLLREPPTGLGRADAVLITHADDRQDRLLARLRQLNATAPVYQSRHVLRGLINAEGGPLSPAEVSPAVAVAGIGNPTAFFQAVEWLGVSTAGLITLPDHAVYDDAVLQQLRPVFESNATLVTTEKDWVKLRHRVPAAAKVARAVLDVDFADGDADSLWNTIDAAIRIENR